MNGLKPVCLRLCVIRLEDWLKDLPQIMHLCGFSPSERQLRMSKLDRERSVVCVFVGSAVDVEQLNKSCRQNRSSKRVKVLSVQAQNIFLSN